MHPADGKLTVANVPVRDGYVRIVNVSPGSGTKPLMSETFRTPASVVVPVTFARSCCVPGVVPPISTLNAPLGACCVYVPPRASVPADNPGDRAPIPDTTTGADTVPVPASVPP